MNQDHSKYHSPNAFCGSAGLHEMQHLNELVTKLTDKELALLVERVGISFGGPEKIDREQYENVIDEADREVFYREYKRIIQQRNK